MRSSVGSVPALDVCLKRAVAETSAQHPVIGGIFADIALWFEEESEEEQCKAPAQCPGHALQ